MTAEALDVRQKSTAECLREAVLPGVWDEAARGVYADYLDEFEPEKRPFAAYLRKGRGECGALMKKVVVDSVEPTADLRKLREEVAEVCLVCDIFALRLSLAPWEFQAVRYRYEEVRPVWELDCMCGQDTVSGWLTEGNLAEWTVRTVELKVAEYCLPVRGAPGMYATRYAYGGRCECGRVLVRYGTGAAA